MSCITEILKLKGDQDVLVPEGNWIAVEGGGTYKNYEYLIVLNANGHRCGYVAIPPEHKYSETPKEMRSFLGGTEHAHWNYDSLDINCHGRLTFMSPEHSLKKMLNIPCNDMWIGFDCAHYNDAIDIDAFRKYYGEEALEKKKSFIEAMSHPYQTIRPYGYLQSQCESIIDQLILAA